MTSKLQVTIPKQIADLYGIGPGTDIDWLPAGDGIRVVPPAKTPSGQDVAFRLAVFDAGTLRQRQRQRQAGAEDLAANGERGWTRAELYDRGKPD